MTEEEFEVAMENCELDEEYYQYIFNRSDFPSEEFIMQAMDYGDYYDGFKGSMVKEFA